MQKPLAFSALLVKILTQTKKALRPVLPWTSIGWNSVSCVLHIIYLSISILKPCATSCFCPADQGAIINIKLSYTYCVTCQHSNAGFPWRYFQEQAGYGLGRGTQQRKGLTLWLAVWLQLQSQETLTCTQEPRISKAGVHRSVMSPLTTFFVLSDGNKEIRCSTAFMIASPTYMGQILSSEAANWAKDRQFLCSSPVFLLETVLRTAMVDISLPLLSWVSIALSEVGFMLDSAVSMALQLNIWIRHFLN